MKKIKFTSHVLPHLVAIIAFILVTTFFFNPIFFENKSLVQPDINMWKASTKSLADFRNKTGEEGLWAPSMFSGMPAYLVSLRWSNGPVNFLKRVVSLFFPHPVNNIFIAFVCYYILLLAFGIRPYLAISGAIAFGLSSFMIIGLGAGHNSRIGAMAFMPLVMAGIHLVFRKKWILGFGVTSAGMALQLRENHIQITYYLLLIVLVYGIVQLAEAIRKKQLNWFFKSTAILIPAVVIAAGTYAGQFWSINEYKDFSFRGPSELEPPAHKEKVTGLTKEYAFQYKYGIWEPMTLLIPEFYGGSSRTSLLSDQKSEVYQALVQNAGDQQTANRLAQAASAYWGPQGVTVGPYYAGAIVCFLFIVGAFYASRKYVWWLLPLAVLSVMLSWGDSFASFNYFLFDYLPGYNKFRSVSFALIIILFTMPLLGLLGLENLLKEGWTKNTSKKLLWPAGITTGICFILAVTGGFGDFLRDFEQQFPAWFTNALQAERSDLLKGDAWRSFWFIVIMAGAIFARLKTWISDPVFYLASFILITTDLALVNKRYFNKENYVRKTAEVTTAPTGADQEILKDKSYYRVFNLQSPWSQDASTSNFHNSIDGYHGAKIRRYQELYDSCLSRQVQRFYNDAQSGNLDFAGYGVLNMLNVKYIIFGPERNNVLRNPNANGNAWFVHRVEKVKSPTEELKRVCEVNTRQTAVINITENPLQESTFDSAGTINIVDHGPNHMKYESHSEAPGLAVFSEIYYPIGWKAAVDGQPAEIMRVNYVLRALSIPAGEHTIEFRFEPASYFIGNKITQTASWLLLVVVAASLGWSVKKEVR